jgi:hypothetical protein
VGRSLFLGGSTAARKAVAAGISWKSPWSGDSGARPAPTVSSCLAIGESHAWQTRGSDGELGKGGQDKNCGWHLGSNHGGLGTREPTQGLNGNPPPFYCSSSLFAGRTVGFIARSSSSSCSSSPNLGWILRACGLKSEQELWKGTAGAGGGVNDLLFRW